MFSDLGVADGNGKVHGVEVLRKLGDPGPHLESNVQHTIIMALSASWPRTPVS
jgi:hypothetical protein